MKLADLRRAAVKNNVRVRFRGGNGVECLVTERGLAEVPELRRAPGFNIEQELESAREFILESNGESKPASREQMQRWASPPTGPAHDGAHDD